ncbi:peptidoglycan-binding domain-containing protein, partial [Bacillus swezeyi]|nr:peptidoglycan-binding domain-containing protein [Bacillus swezeyi]
AVKRFQLMNGLSADGIYGPKTKAKIESLLK